MKGPSDVDIVLQHISLALVTMITNMVSIYFSYRLGHRHGRTMERDLEAEDNGDQE